MRSSMPPCPGISVPESFEPAARLSIDFGEVTRLRDEPEQRAEDDRAHRRLAQPGQQQRGDHRARDEPADQPFDRLRGRDVGHELVPADLAADEVGARVVAPHAEHEQQDPAALRAQGRSGAVSPTGGADRRDVRMNASRPT